MSNASDDTESISTGTLYDPPEGQTTTATEDEDRITLRLSLPQERAERLRAVAQQLGLTPSMVAQRAIDLVCEEVVTIQDDTRTTDTLIEEYQARLDLLHTVEETANGEPEADTSDD